MCGKNDAMRVSMSFVSHKQCMRIKSPNQRVSCPDPTCSNVMMNYCHMGKRTWVQSWLCWVSSYSSQFWTNQWNSAESYKHCLLANESIKCIVSSLFKNQDWRLTVGIHQTESLSGAAKEYGKTILKQHLGLKKRLQRKSSIYSYGFDYFDRMWTP